MKIRTYYLTLLITLCCVFTAQGQTTSAPEPTPPVANVLPVYADTKYTGISDLNFGTWWQVSISTSNINLNEYKIATLEEEKEGNWALGISNFGALNLTNAGMTYLHIDVFAPKISSYTMNVGTWTSDQASSYSTTITISQPNKWIGVDILLSELTHTGEGSQTLEQVLANCQFLKLEGSEAISFDNIYFFGGLTASTGPTLSAPTPGYDENVVKSLYSDTYSPMPNITFNGADEYIGANQHKKLASLTSQSITTSATNVSDMDFLHLDVWASSSSATLSVNVGDGSNTSIAVPVTLTANNWSSIDIPFTEFGNNINFSTINTVTLTGNGTSVFIDNVFFYFKLKPLIAAPDPILPARRVISLFSDTYDNLPVSFPDWGQTTEFSIQQINGNNYYEFYKLDYLPIDLNLNDNVNTTEMTHLHFDYWPQNNSGKRVIIGDWSSGETEKFNYDFTGNPNMWNPIDIPLTNFPGFDPATNKINFIQFDNGGGDSIFVDNLYLYKAISTPTAAAAIPPRLCNVTSVYSDSFDNISGVDFNEGNATVSFSAIYGNNYAKLTTFTNQAVLLGSGIDLSQMDSLHLDIWIDEGSQATLGLFLSDNTSANSNEINVTLQPGSWNNIQVALNQFTGINLSNVAKLHFRVNNGREDIVLDNIYFYKSPVSSGPGTSATIPDYSPDNVISVYSNSYTNLPNAAFEPGDATVCVEYIDTNQHLKLTGLNNKGINLGEAINLSRMKYLHVDVWVDNATSATLNFTLTDNTSTTSVSVGKSLTAGAWTDINIALPDFTGINLEAVTSLALSLSTSNEANKTVFIDNIYFYTKLEPLTAAPDPIRPARRVISFFSDTYDNVSLNFPGWGMSTKFSIQQINGNNYYEIYNLNYLPIQLVNAINVGNTKMSHLHFDYYPRNGAAKRLIIGDWSSGSEVRFQYDFTGNPNTWNSIDIPLADFQGFDPATNTINFFQFDNGGGDSIFIDNFYLYKISAPTVAAPVPPFICNAISIYSDSFDNISGIDFNEGDATVSFSDVNGNNYVKLAAFTNQAVLLGSGIDLSQTDSLHLDVWIDEGSQATLGLFMSDNASTNSSVTNVTLEPNSWNNIQVAVSQFSGINLSNVAKLHFRINDGREDIVLDNIYFDKHPVSTGPGASATIPGRSSNNVVSVYSNSYTDLPDVVFTPGDATVCAEYIGTNQHLKLIGLNSKVVNLGDTINLSQMDSLHIDVWVDNATSATLNLTLTDSTNKTSAVVGRNLTAGAWTNIDITLSAFTGIDLRAVTSLTLSLSTNNEANRTIFIDNLYFYKYATPSIPVVVVSGSNNADGEYGSLFDAFDRIRFNDQAGRSIDVKIIGNSTETRTVEILNSNDYANWDKLDIYPSGGQRTINFVPVASTTEYNKGCLFRIGDVNNVNFIGSIDKTGTTRDLTLIGNYDQSHPELSTVILFSPYGTIQNDNITIKNCIFTSSDVDNRPVQTIFGAGTNITIENNEFKDCLNLNETARNIGIIVSGNTEDELSSDNWVIKDNHFYETSRVIFKSAIMRAFISLRTTSAAASFIVSGNYIGGSEPFCGGSPLVTGTSGTAVEGETSTDLDVISIVFTENSVPLTVVENNTIANFDCTNNTDSLIRWDGNNSVYQKGIAYFRAISVGLGNFKLSKNTIKDISWKAIGYDFTGNEAQFGLLGIHTYITPVFQCDSNLMQNLRLNILPHEGNPVKIINAGIFLTTIEGTTPQ